MGLHSPFGYVNEEQVMLDTLIRLCDDFCRGCHTNDDYTNGCSDCPVGRLIYACRDYLADVYMGDYQVPGRPKKYDAKYKETLGKIKKAMKRFKVHPGFNSSWIFQDAPSKDKLVKLRWWLKELEFYHSQASHPFMNIDKLKESEEHKEEELRKLPSTSRKEAIKGGKK